jgi:hypothetical protein
VAGFTDVRFEWDTTAEDKRCLAKNTIINNCCGAAIKGNIHLHRGVIVVLPDSIGLEKVVKHYLDNK